MNREQLTEHIAKALRQHPDVIQASEIEPGELGIETTDGLFIVTAQPA
ncbi:hypothetical protein ABZT27_34420 [Streptomyces sp. NPDC005389]